MGRQSDRKNHTSLSLLGIADFWEARYSKRKHLSFTFSHLKLRESMNSSVPVSLLYETPISQERPSSPHPAFFFALPHLRLSELFIIRLVCKSLRDAVDADPLIWRSITVEPPLSSKLTDSILLDITAKAQGGLRSLALIDCGQISDGGLLRVAERNPGITKLHVPGCVSLTPANTVRVVRMLSKLKCLRLHGLLYITQEDINSINSLLQENSPRPPMFYNSIDDRPIDVDICPKCNDIRLVFDCPRAQCQEKERFPCRGCSYCIERCEECGGCIDLEDLGEGPLCSHLFCSECWLRLPKCLLCNQPTCSQRSSAFAGFFGPGFTCEMCSVEEGCKLWQINLNPEC